MLQGDIGEVMYCCSDGIARVGRLAYGLKAVMSFMLVLLAAEWEGGSEVLK